MEKRNSHIITSIIFIIIIFSLSIVTIISGNKEFSEKENRYLKQVPMFTFDKLLNRNLTDEYNEYYNDQFIFRDNWISLKVTTDFLLGKRENGGVYFSKDYLVEKVQDNGKGYSKKNRDNIIRFSKQYGNNTNIYFMLIPSTSEIQSYKLPKYEERFDQFNFIKNTYKQTENYIKNINIYNDLMSHKNEYIYYRTDHHWTTDGAYIAYEKMSKEMGFNAIEYDDFDVRTMSKAFKGSLYSKFGLHYIKPDEIKAVNNDNIDQFVVWNGNKEVVYKNIYFKDYLNKKDKYSYFLGTNEPKVIIRSNTDNNKRLLIFKDSYAHCLVPFLTYSYSEITLIDMRYVNIDINELVDISNYDDVLFMYCIDVFLNTKNTSKLAYTY